MDQESGNSRQSGGFGNLGNPSLDPGCRVVTGLVLPASWSEDGRVESVTISAFDETDYVVACGPVGGKLLGLLRQEVEVRGWISASGSSLMRIEVEYFKVIDTGRDAEED